MSPVVDLQELARQYEAQTDEELLRLSLAAAQLAPEARTQLQAEMAKRGIDTAARLEEFHEEEIQAAAEPLNYSKKGVGIDAALQDWKLYRRQTGDWPILSVAATLV